MQDICETKAENGSRERENITRNNTDQYLGFNLNTKKKSKKGRAIWAKD